MFKTYIKIAFRNLWRYKFFSFINVLGLAIGMASCFLIFLYVRFEFNYDSFHKNADRTYRLVADITNSTGTHPGYQTSWLEDFRYRIQITCWMFASVGMAAIIIALATVSLQAIKAAMVNPVESLRME